MISIEKQIIEGCIKQDRMCQGQLYQRFSGKMLAICQRYTKDKEMAEDAFQNAFVKVFRYINNFNFQSSLETWLTRIFINESLNLIKSAKRLSLQINIEDVPFQLSENSNDVPENFDSELVLMLLNKIPENYKVVLMMYAIDGFSHKEIAETLNMPESTSRSTLSRARNLLLNLYNNELDSHETKRYR